MFSQVFIILSKFESWAPKFNHFHQMKNVIFKKNIINKWFWHILHIYWKISIGLGPNSLLDPINLLITIKGVPKKVSANAKANEFWIKFFISLPFFYYFRLIYHTMILCGKIIFTKYIIICAKTFLFFFKQTWRKSEVIMS